MRSSMDWSKWKNWKRIILLGIVATCVSQAQTLNGGTGNAQPGKPVTASISLDTGGQAIAAIQFDLAVPTVVGFDSTVSGSASTVPDKSLTCAQVGGTTRCLLFGINQTTLPDGVIANVTFQTQQGWVDPVNAPLGNVSAASPDGQTVAVSAGTVMVLEPGPLCPDLNGDGVTNVIDVQLAAIAAIGGQCQQ